MANPESSTRRQVAEKPILAVLALSSTKYEEEPFDKLRVRRSGQVAQRPV